MHVAITGSSGLIGTALSAALTAAGHRVVPLVRRTATADEIAWDPTAGVLDPADLNGIDAVVHLAGAGIGDRRWTESYKLQIRESRVRSTNLLCEAIAAADDGPKVLLSGSAIGYYGSRGDEILDEESAAGKGFLADVCADWETSTALAAAAGVRVTLLRTGIVLSTGGGALKKQLPIFKAGLGGRFGSGAQWQSWISLDDEVGAIMFLLEHEIAGPVNLTAPEPVTNAQFTKTLAGVLKRPAVLPIPAFGPKLLLGAELATNLLFEGQRVLPRVLEGAGYQFEHPDLETALRALLNNTA